MRSYLLIALALAAASISVSPALAQEDGDAVTYTRGEVIYTGVLDGDLDTVSLGAIRTIVAGDVVTTTALVAATTTAAVVSDDSLLETSPTIPTELDEVIEEEPSGLLLFQQPLQRRDFTPKSPSPTALPLLKRQQGGAALGGGGGALTTQTGLQVISGYTPPDATTPASPVAVSSGTSLAASQIPGYTGTENTDGVSSGSAKLLIANLAVGFIGGAAIVALM